MEEIDLSAALEQFDRVLANIELLEKTWERFEPHIPDSISFGLDTDEIEQIRREFTDIVESMPAIDGDRLEAELPILDDISHMRLEYSEAGLEIEGFRNLQDYIQEPKKAIDDYKFRITKLRRRLVRNRIEQVVGEIDACLRNTLETSHGREFRENRPGWSFLSDALDELDRLRGQESLSDTRLGDFRRHIHFAESHDLRDIVEMDWPSVRDALVDQIFEGEPLFVAVADVGDLVRAEPTGAVTSRLAWSDLSATSFERLIFDILRSARSYENIEWLMEINAPDRGRDLSVDRVVVDDLTGTKHVHVLVQCRHWLSRSIGVRNLNTLLEEVGLWSKNFAVVIVVTSGRFTQNAVDWREQRELKGSFPAVEFWANSHLEHLLASRPAIRAQYFEGNE
ncbi:restriction endonuclease [Candidatus Poriferisodalis sp.]|uniref:restriction endonuclease n=1 Tax=Candidatus Poriferisodalis sp. TaxID=3101277 RepID=UPI003B5BBBB7